jgi:hypothetical protein
MNVEIGAEAALFPEKEYINGIAIAVHISNITVKKGMQFSRPKPGCHLPNSPYSQKYFNYSRPGRVWLVTSRLGTGKSFTFFYSVRRMH